MCCGIAIFLYSDYIVFEQVSNKQAFQWKKVSDVAQYKWADTSSRWSNEIRRENGLTVSEAKAIAEKNEQITYFFITKGEYMILEGNDTHEPKGVFKKGDVVFFSGKPWYGAAPGYADAYEKFDSI